jgi:hypothetical protein
MTRDTARRPVSRLARRLALVAVLQFSLGVAWAQEPSATNLSHEAQQQVRAFVQAHGIAAWPRPQGCNYDRPWDGLTMGAVLQVHVAEQAGRRYPNGQNLLVKGLTCHVRIAHALRQWPGDLPSGIYVVAVRAVDGVLPQRPGTLQVVAVLPQTGDGSALARTLAAALDAGEVP